MQVGASGSSKQDPKWHGLFWLLISKLQTSSYEIQEDEMVLILVFTNRKIKVGKINYFN